ncbi:hypothetical protein PG991_003309 [Apiospora marii]|uniref:Zn(2)-C6 fungal-type domain-containing protein n=1 Tax=Apiospora marii TaxID=335849 RepID=A0ABR1SHV4_9PEZI
MVASPPTSRDSHSQPPQPDPDSDSASVTNPTAGRRKRARSNGNNDEPSVAACDQCRLRKVRCDRKQPECSNCKRSRVECSSSSTLKRVNHTKQLRDDFTVVLKRLDHVDETLASLTKFIHHVAAQPPGGGSLNNVPSWPSTSQIPGLPPSSEPLDFDQPNTPDSDGPSTSEHPTFETAESDEGDRVYGYPAPLVLVKALLRQASGPLLGSDEHGDNPGRDGETAYITRALHDSYVRVTFQKKLDEFPFKSRRPEPPVLGDANPVTTPPRLLANLFIQGYLKNINPRTPIFDEAELHSAIEAHYSEEHSPRDNTSWALIINNIVLLELGLEIQATRASQSNSRGMNDDILPSFLKNCDRAIANLGAFSTPSLVNVQALITLVLVARDFYSHTVAQRVCQAACNAGKILGLHRSKPQPWGESSESDAAGAVRQRVFQVLYTMDKQRVFMTGLPCDLHMFDSDHRPFSDPSGQLANIWEEIYLNLYTSRAMGLGADARARQVQQLSNSLSRFAQRHAKSVPPSPGGVEDMDPITLELVYGFHVSQVLVLRCDRRSEASQERMLELARKSLRLVLAVCNLPPTTQRLGLLASIIGNYPMVAFFELASYRLAGLFKTGEADAAVQADISLLRAVCEHVQMPEHDKLKHIFHSRLVQGLRWTSDLLEFLGESIASLAPNRDGSATQNPPSPTIPELLNGCPIRLPKVDHGPSSLPPSRPGETIDFALTAGLAKRTDFGFFTPMGTDSMDVSSRPHTLLSARDFAPPTSGTMAPSSQQQASDDFMTSSSDWGNFDSEYFHGAFGQGTTGWS